jgi:phospholipase C
MKVALGGAVLAAVAGMGISTTPSSAGLPGDFSTPIQHVIVIDQENHSFNEVLGWLCQDNDHPCLGTGAGTLPDGTSIELRPAPDLVANVAHESVAQSRAIDGGRMDGFSANNGCTEAQNYACYDQYQPKGIPDLAVLAKRYAISDHTFEMNAVPSWGSHLELAAGTLDGFVGDNPHAVKGITVGPGWGCDSNRNTPWISPSGERLQVPSCVPDQAGAGPYTGPGTSPVPWVPTIMDRLDQTGLTWRIYGSRGRNTDATPYGWAICPAFADCLYTAQSQNVSPPAQVVDDAQAGVLPNLSIVTPEDVNSQHNGWSMLQGDNWIGSVVNAVMSGPEWNSTAIFITYDDCGCFYDEVPPPAGLGIRVPMVIVSPYAKLAHVDSNDASFASLLAFTEHVFGVQPLSDADATAYDYMDSFDFSQPPTPGVHLVSHPVPRWEWARLRAHPPPYNDPT